MEDSQPQQPAKRSRSANYTAKEKEVLISLAVKYKSIIENKKTDNVSVSEKNQAWINLADEFNAISPNLCFRSADSLKKFYDNSKKELRRKIGDYKKELFTTGGGPPPVLKKDVDDEVLLSIVSEKSLFGLSNPFDKDGCNTGVTVEAGDMEHIILPDGNVMQEQHSKKASDDLYVSTNNVPNNIEICWEEELGTEESINNLENHSEEQSNIYSKNWSKYKVSDLSQSKPLKLKAFKAESQDMQEKRKEIKSRRRPHSTIKTMSASNLHDKYEKLVEQKLVTENLTRQKSGLEIKFLQREHEARMKSLELDIKIKEKQFELLNRK